MPLVWIPATLCVGLLIAAVYLGGRILTAHTHANSPAHADSSVQASVTVQTPAPVQATPAAAQAAPSITPQPEPEAPAPEAPKLVAGEPAPMITPPMITPQAGERYIQVSALNAEAAERYIRQLRQANLEPHMAPGPRPELLRVLIGPFADQDALTQTQSYLARAGIKNFVRKY